MTLSIVTKKADPKYRIEMDGVNYKADEIIITEDLIYSYYRDLPNTKHKVSILFKTLLNSNFWLFRLLNPIRFISYAFFKSELVLKDESTETTFEIDGTCDVEVFLTYKVTVNMHKIKGAFLLQDKDGKELSYYDLSERKTYLKHKKLESIIPPCFVLLAIILRLIYSSSKEPYLYLCGAIYLILFIILRVLPATGRIQTKGK